MSVKTGVRASPGIGNSGVGKSPQFPPIARILMGESKPRRRPPRSVGKGILFQRILIQTARTGEGAEEVGVCPCPIAVIPLLRGPARGELPCGYRNSTSTGLKINLLPLIFKEVLDSCLTCPCTRVYVYYLIVGSGIVFSHIHPSRL